MSQTEAIPIPQFSTTNVIPILSQYLLFLMKVLMFLSMSNYEDAAGNLVPGVLCDVESKQRNNYIKHTYLWKRNYFPHPHLHLSSKNNYSPSPPTTVIYDYKQELLTSASKVLK